MSGYELSRDWFDFCFENPEKISPNHTAIFFFAIEHCNRLGWKVKFGFPTQMAMDALGIKKHQTYIKYFSDLCEWGFFVLVQKSSNQYSSNIISLSTGLPKNGKALDKAIITHTAKQTQTNGQSNSSIDKPNNHKPNNHKPQTELPEAKPPRPRNDFHDVFDKWFLSIAGVPYEMGKKDWVGINQIKKYCEKNSKNGNPLESFALVLSKYDNLPRFYQENRNPAFIASKFSEIISLLKKPVKSQGQDNIVDLYNKTHAEPGQQEGNIDFTKHLEK